MQEYTPLVSMIIPIYNGEKYLDLCLESIAAQTYQNLEILLVDDGSTDSSPEMCDAFASQDSRIRVIHKPNGGLSSARNAGLDTMRGEYVTFVDCDDFLFPDMVDFFVRTALEYDCDVVTGASVDTRERRIAEVDQLPLEVITMTGQEVLYNRERYAVTVMHKLYKSTIFSDLRFTEGMIYEDAAILAPLLWQSKKIAITNRKVYYYYLSPNSIMRSSFSVKRLDAIKVYDLRREFYRGHGLSELDERNTVDFYVRIGKLWYEMCQANWPERKHYLPMIQARERELRPEAIRSRYYSVRLRLQRFAFRYLPYITGAYLNSR